MQQSHSPYHSFLIRLWLEVQDDDMGEEWQIELESIQNGQKYLFPDLEAMLQFLRQQTKTTQVG